MNMLTAKAQRTQSVLLFSLENFSAIFRQLLPASPKAATFGSSTSCAPAVVRFCGENGVYGQALGNGNRFEKLAHPFHDRQVFSMFRRRLQAMADHGRQNGLQVFG
jgi:hypothetical protein